MNSTEVRQKFLDFFRSKQHEIVPSAPMVIKDDPTLLFTNAGMNQFKDIFLGHSTARFSRVANTQKCLRVSGKHNDLEEVGHDGYHHTMFEMLGNWSFGDYFKQEAVDWAWEFLTSVVALDPANLYATVFEGSTAEGIERDNDAIRLWSKYLPESQILTGSKKDNFWEMGDSGPCGPCSEIHVDLRTPEEKRNINGRELVNKGDPRVIEIWNLVFIQYNRKVSGELEPLPKQHVDTGMGFERLCMALQGKTSNYDTDIFQPIIGRLAKLTGKTYGSDKQCDVAMRVIADHLRAVTFAIADGQLPSNVRAGYVIRRILRRAVRYNYTFLDQNKPLIYKLLPALVETMGHAFPELIVRQQHIEKVILEEEQSFLHTLETGDRRLKEGLAAMKESGEKVFSAKIAFELYDTYGFPFDLTELILREQGFVVDKDGFDHEMETQRSRSKQASSVETSDWVVLASASDAGSFVGYSNLQAEVSIVRYRLVNQKGKQAVHLVFDTTPFYAESGGQVGDTGYLTDGEKKISIHNTFREHGLVIHAADRLPDDPSGKFTAAVSESKRRSTEKNHSATHLLHHALRKVLGDHVEQRGSLVTADGLRFDFSHFQKVTEEELSEVEDQVNRQISLSVPRNEWNDVPLARAREMGAMALFGEKYGDSVRVIGFGDSVELCGGTHVVSTSQIGLFKIISESSIAAGIRRIEAVTGEKALDFFKQRHLVLSGMERMIGSNTDPLRVLEGLLADREELAKLKEELRKEEVRGLKDQFIKSLQSLNGMNLLWGKVLKPLSDAGVLRDLAYQLRGEVDNLVFVAGAVSAEKPFLAIMVADNLVAGKKLHAGEIVKVAAREMDGGGGGQPFFATAGGKKAAGLDAAIDKAIELIRQK